MFDDRGPAQRRNDRSGALQREQEIKRVWVDLAVAYPRPRDRPVRPMPVGVDLQSRVPGVLLAWRRTTTGEWVGWVCLPVRRGEEIRYVYQYVPAAALSPRDDVPDRRAD